MCHSRMRKNKPNQISKEASFVSISSHRVCAQMRLILNKVHFLFIPTCAKSTKLFGWPGRFECFFPAIG